MNSAPIGVFDSGLGGLTVWKELCEKLPRESLLYFGDGLNCPYGDRPQDEVVGFVDAAVRRMLDEGVKLVVVACNAATAMAIDHLRSTYEVPFIGLEPAVKPAVESTRTGVVGVLATAATLAGGLFRATAERYGDRAEIIPAVGRGFVELVEANREQSEEAYRTVERALAPLLARGADRIVLGCTHYPFLSNAMRRVIGASGVELINSAEAIERRAESLLREHRLEAPEGNTPRYTFRTFGDEAYRSRLIAKSEWARTINF